MNESKNELVAPSEQTVNALAAAAEQGVLAWKDANAFGRMFKVAGAVQTLRGLLGPEAMGMIMELQDTPLGFRTDKAREGGYAMPVVREALIEATLQGVYPVGNEFNIIGGRCYITKEGFGHKLRDVPGLRWSVTPGVPEIGQGGARVSVDVEWSLNGGTAQRRTLEFAIRLNAGMGADAVCGKATRKARAWLWSEVTGNETPDGDAQEVEARVVGSPKDRSSGAGAEEEAPAPEDAAAEREKLTQWLKDAARAVGEPAKAAINQALKKGGAERVSQLTLPALRECKEAVNRAINE